jgi:hypothetical protein
MRATMGTLVVIAVTATLSACALEEDVTASGELVLLRDPDATLAQASPSGCHRGDFCAYSLVAEQGRLLLRAPGNWSGSISDVGSIFNNGVPFPGADHVQLDWNINGLGWTRCIHYNPGPGVYNIDFVGIQVVRVRWRGECGPGEDQSHRR